MKKKRKLRGKWLAALGAALLALALIALAARPSVLQYGVVAPAEADAASGEAAASKLSELLKGWEAARKDELSEVLSAATVAARDYTCALAGEGGSAVCTLAAVGAGWFDIYPHYLLSGRLIGGEEFASGAAVMVLDEPLAFKLFPTSDPLGQKVRVGEAWYRVIGVVRYARGLGEYEQYQAYIPIQCAADKRMQMEIVEVSGVPVPRSGASRAFEAAAGDWAAGGTFTDLDKEAMRAAILPRVMAILFGLYLLLALVRRVNDRVRAMADEVRARLKTEYFRAMLPGLAPRMGLALFCYALLAGAAGALLSLAIEPMYVFTEWIPEVLVEMSSITARFWQLTSAAARPVLIRTREYAEIRFWAGLARWGTVALLSGGALMAYGAGRRAGEKKGKTEK